MTRFDTGEEAHPPQLQELPVPVVDMEAPQEVAAATLKAACLTTGFFYVTNHGIGEELIAEQFNKSRSFFELPADKKALIKVNKYYRGWTPMADETLDPENSAAADTKEGMYIGREIAEGSEENKKPLHGPNNWPDEELVPGFRRVMMQYHSACLACTLRINKLIAIALDLPASFFDADFTRPIVSLRPLHYAPSISAPEKGQYAAGAHTDYGILTILATDEQPGLQILLNDKWTAMPPRPGHLIVNLGDMLHRWTNGRFKSAMHRVITSSGKERFSTAFFAEPNFEAEVAPLPTCISNQNPPRWPPTTSGEYLMSRYAATHSTFASRQKVCAAA